MKTETISLLTAILTMFFLGGCSTPRPPTPNATTEAPNPIQLSTIVWDHTVQFLPGKFAPDAAETISLNVFLQTNEIMRGDPIMIERDNAPGDDKRAEIMAAALSRQGLTPSVIVAATASPGELRLVIERTVAKAVNCPNWSKTPGNDFDNTLHSDFGCATAINLAAMIANPRDLEDGRALGPQVGDAALDAIHRYRTGKIPALANEGSPSPGAPAAAAPPAGGQ